MPQDQLVPLMSDATTGRADHIFQDHLQGIHRRTDLIFVELLVVQWLAGIAAAIWISPRSWVGLTSQTHIHVWAALLLGGAIIAFPIALALVRPGSFLTRHIIAIAQMLMGALLIHLTGGRVETHFHIFGSLALLAFYRDWRVLVTGSLIVALDHLLRGIFWPQSIFGVAFVSHWRWLEHVGWVALEDLFLIRSCTQGLCELGEISSRQAQLEGSRDRVELAVVQRTSELARQTTVLRQTVEKLRQSEEHFHAAFDSTAVGIALIATDGRWIQVNRALCEIMGYSESELLATNFQSLTPSDDLVFDLE